MDRNDVALRALRRFLGPETLHSSFSQRTRPYPDTVPQILGRVDDVLNVSGHRLSTMEIESALVSHDQVVEAAVVPRPDDLTGEAIVAFVIPAQGADDAAALAGALGEHVATEIGKLARPAEVRVTPRLPKTRSGKIMRRLLRAIASGEEITQDTTTLEDPTILDELRADGGR